MTSLSVNYASTSPSTLVPGSTPNLIPFQPQHDNYICLNPSGLPAGTYHIEQIAEDSSNINANIEWALNLSTNDYWVRHCTAVSNGPTLPVWGAWLQVNGGGGGGGVISWTGDQGTTRTGLVSALPGDYNSDDIVNNSFVPGADVTAALQALANQSGVVSFNGRQGNVIPLTGDYTDANITNTSSVPGPHVFDALNNLLTDVNNKVTLGNAITAGDLLVANAAGDNYVPSVTSLGFPAHAAAIQAGQPSQVATTAGGAVLEAAADGPALTGSLVRASLGAAGTTNANFSCVLADAVLDANFGQHANIQSGHRVILPAGLPAATGSAGAYGFILETNGGGIPFFVNSSGQTRITLSPGPSATLALALDANGMLCLL